MLLAKIRYALGDHQGALDRLEEVVLDSLPLADISSRKLKLIGESFAIKGWCFPNVFVSLVWSLFDSFRLKTAVVSVVISQSYLRYC